MVINIKLHLVEVFGYFTLVSVPNPVSHVSCGQVLSGTAKLANAPNRESLYHRITVKVRTRLRCMPDRLRFGSGV